MKNDEIAPKSLQSATVLVPLDGSEAALAVLPIAKVMAEAIGAIVHIIHVAPVHLPRKELLDSLKLRADQVRGIAIDQVTGPIAAAIVEQADRRRSAFIAMSAYGRKPAQILGPVAQEVLQKASCPVVLVRPDVPVSPGGPGTALRRILLPLDGTPSTSAATTPAIDLAESSRAALDILLVAAAGVSRPEERGTFVSPRYVDQPHHEWPAWTQEFINRLCRSLSGCPTVPMHLSLASGEPAKEILRVARERETDLIVLVWRGSIAGKRGAIIKAVLQGTPCPILILRAAGVA